MFERFDERARRVVVLAQGEARQLEHDCIGTEHLLLGLLEEGEGLGAQALASLGVTAEEVRAIVEDVIGRGAGPKAGHIPFTERAKRVLAFSCGSRTSSGIPPSGRSTYCSRSWRRRTAWAPRC